MTILAPILWSTGGLAIRAVDTDPWATLFWRTLFMVLTVSVISGVSATRASRSERSGSLAWDRVGPVLLAGACIGASLVLYVLSMTRTSIAASLIVQASGPLFIVVFGWILLREPVRPITVVAIVAVATGIAVIVVPSIQRGGLDGNVFGILKALGFAGAAITIRRFHTARLIPATVVGAVLATTIAAAVAPSLRATPREIAILAAMGVFQSGLAFSLFAAFSGQVESSVTGLIVLLESVLGPVWVWLVFSEAPTVATLIGGGIVLSALVAHTLLLGRSAADSTPVDQATGEAAG